MISALNGEKPTSRGVPRTKNKNTNGEQVNDKNKTVDTTTVSAPLPQPSNSYALGILPLDVTRLAGSQRIGIIGLPFTTQFSCTASFVHKKYLMFSIAHLIAI